MKELILHIGLSKTGSSAIQSWLSLNNKKLQNFNYYYLDLIPEAKNGKITAGNGILLFNACKERDWLEVECLLNVKYFSQYKKAIVSSETLQHITPESINKIKEICDRNEIKVKVIAFARSAYELLYSNYLQGVKRHGYFMPFEKQDLSYNSQRNFIENYHKVFSKNFSLYNYDFYKNDLILCFKEYLGLEKCLFDEMPIKKINRSLTEQETLYLIKLNKLHRGEFSTKISDFLISQNPSLNTATYYTEELLEKVRENTKDDIDWINKNKVIFGTELKSDNYDSVKEIAEERYNILDVLIQWCLAYNDYNNPISFVNFIRDFALLIENESIENALLLMKRANTLRPNGIFIKRRLDIYINMLSMESI